jgi:hypothetical protein
MAKRRGWKVVPGFLTKNQERLIEKCFKKTEMPPENVTVRELGRIGQSGARLLWCQPSRGIPWVAKIHKKEKILR